MKSTFSIFVATTLLLASTGAVAARGVVAGNRNAVIAPVPQISTAPPQTNPIGGVNQNIGGGNQNFDPVPGFAQTNPVTGEAFGALPGAPGSPTFDPNAALPNVNVPGSALAPLGSSINAPGSGTTIGQ
jgi:hypothetical protein